MMIRIVRTKIEFGVPFSTASSSVKEKECVFLQWGESESSLATWELTWSPSLGTNAQDLFEATKSFAIFGDTDCPVLKCHLEWIKFLGAENAYFESLDQTQLQGDEHSVDRAVSWDNSNQFTRIKCKGIIPKYVYSSPYSGILILDFNGSAIEDDLDGFLSLADRLPFREIWIEEPYSDGSHIQPFKGIRRVFDRALEGLSPLQVLSSQDIFVLKLPRNPPSDYLLLRNLELNVMVGGVLSSSCGDEIASHVSSSISTVCLGINHRDGVSATERVKAAKLGNKTDLLKFCEIQRPSGVSLEVWESGTSQLF